VKILRIKKNQFRDSLYLMRLSEEISRWEKVVQAVIVMGTENNKKILSQLNLGGEALAEASSSDMVIALELSPDAAQEDADRLLARLEERLNQAPGGSGAHQLAFEGALQARPDIDMVVISVPGQHAPELIRKSIDAGKDVFCFSQHVPMEEELALKRQAVEKGVLLMGPDCGTSIIDGYGIGFANSVRPGNIGLISASGSGLQEVVSLITRSGGGISQAIGVGGNDMRAPVNGLMAVEAVKRLKQDPRTEVIVIIAKAASPEAVERVIAEAKTTGLPIVADFGAVENAALDKVDSLRLVDTFEECARQAVLLAGGEWSIAGREEDFRRWMSSRLEAGAAKKAALRGLFAGGSLCGEALSICRKGGMNVQTNLGYYEDNPGDILFLDLGAEEFTEGRPHPFIDHRLRSMEIEKAYRDEVGLILLDVVIGWGSHPDPAGEVVKALEKAEKKHGRGTAVIASICGTAGDYQNYDGQQAKLAGEGVFVAESNAAAARYALSYIEEMRRIQNEGQRQRE
jgi:FdrA protein